LTGRRDFATSASKVSQELTIVSFCFPTVGWW
jgi:hypothetical protein